MHCTTVSRNEIYCTCLPPDKMYCTTVSADKIQCTTVPGDNMFCTTVLVYMFCMGHNVVLKPFPRDYNICFIKEWIE